MNTRVIERIESQAAGSKLQHVKKQATVETTLLPKQIVKLPKKTSDR